MEQSESVDSVVGVSDESPVASDANDSDSDESWVRELALNMEGETAEMPLGETRA